MKILIAYATTDGQTRKIARRAADTVADRGHAVELLPAADAADLDLARFDGVVLAGSVHAEGYQPALVALATDRAAELNARPTLFLSVSLSAAGDDAEDWAGLRRIEAEFRSRTGWRPGAVEQVAGAFAFSRYDPFRAWAMRRIARIKDPAADPHQDKEYTDWARLEECISDWLAGLGGAQAAPQVRIA